MAKEKELGEYIVKANPYTTTMDPMLDEVEQDTYVVTWYFKNGSYRIGKALRIPYCYKDAKGLDVKDYILVGYEGAGF